MRFEERELNIYEKVIDAIEDAIKRDKRVKVIGMSQAEYDEFYQLAMGNLPTTAINEFMSRKIVLGAQVVIEEEKKPVPKKKG